MDVKQSVYERSSIRQFLPTPVADEVLRELLIDASRAPSGGNLQPWRIYVLNGETTQRFHEHLATQPPIEAVEYDMYPANLWEPYRTNRFAIGEQMYALLGIDRDDKPGRQRQFARNNELFGAPAAIFCFVDRGMGQCQWSDLGMFLQTFMLLAVERGLATCPQEFWSLRHEAVQSFVGAPANEMLFCGVAIGHADREAPVNSLRSERMPLDEWARFV